jgi:hypothetical protein
LPLGARAAVLVGQRQALDTALRGGADARQFHQGIPEPGGIDAEFVHDGACVVAVGAG